MSPIDKFSVARENPAESRDKQGEGAAKAPDDEAARQARRGLESVISSAQKNLADSEASFADISRELGLKEAQSPALAKDKEAISRMTEKVSKESLPVGKELFRDRKTPFESIDEAEKGIDLNDYFSVKRAMEDAEYSLRFINTKTEDASLLHHQLSTVARDLGARLKRIEQNRKESKDSI